MINQLIWTTRYHLETNLSVDFREVKIEYEPQSQYLHGVWSISDFSGDFGEDFMVTSDEINSLKLILEILYRPYFSLASIVSGLNTTFSGDFGDI